jgi:hypothetical protein
MTAKSKFTEATAVGEMLPGWAGGDPSVVEMRLHFDGYDSTSGRLEGRDAEGRSLFRTDLRQLIVSLPCFTAQSLVATGQGLAPVGSLTPGTRVITRDNGMQELRWVGRRRFDWRALGLNPLLRPVRIAAGALGDGLPERDMVVSPNHRFLTRMSGEGAAGERLTMARDLVGLDGIIFDSVTEIEYWQLLFTRHELVLADGSWSESFLPTPSSLAALGENGRNDLTIALPGIEADVMSGFDSVRPFAETDSAA